MGSEGRGNKRKNSLSFISLKITLFTFKIFSENRMGHDRSRDSGFPQRQWKLGLKGQVTWGLAGLEVHFGEENCESPNAEVCLWEGEWVGLTQETVVWVLSSRCFQNFKYYSWKQGNHCQWKCTWGLWAPSWSPTCPRAALSLLNPSASWSTAWNH